MTTERWVNLVSVVKVEYGTRPHTLVMTFDNPAACQEALELFCTGHQLRGGDLLHDEGKYCPVHARMSA